MVLKSKTSRFFGLAEDLPDGFTFDDLNKNRPVLVYNYKPYISKSKTIRFERKEHKYLKRFLTVHSMDSDLINPNKYFNKLFNFNRGGTMNIPELVKVATESQNVDATETIVKNKLGEQIHWAIKHAQKNNAFTAVPVLKALQDRYPRKKGAQSTLSEADKAQAVEVKLNVDSTVDAGIKEAILDRARQIGTVVSETANRAVFLIRNKEADGFIKAVEAADGVSVEATIKDTAGSKKKTAKAK